MLMVMPLLALAIVLGVRELRARSVAGGDAVLHDVPAVRSGAAVRPVPDRARAVAVLARREARQMLVHPSVLVGMLLAMLFVGAVRGETGFDRYITLTGGAPMGLYLPPLTFFAANLCASRARRSRSAELFDATAATPADRTLALCLAALGPALASAALVAVGYAFFSVTDPALPATPPFAQLLALPVAVLGAGTLGVMIARWLPFRGASLVVFVGIVVASIWFSNDSPMLVTLTEFPDWQLDETFVLVPGVPAAAHAAFIFGLSVMAAIGALLVHPGRRRLLLALGALAVAGTAVAGVLAEAT